MPFPEPCRPGPLLRPGAGQPEEKGGLLLTIRLFRAHNGSRKNVPRIANGKRTDPGTGREETHMTAAAMKKVGALIRSARLDRGLTQEQLARKVKNCSASDIGKAERGEKELTTEQLKQIAKATGVTQKSLLDAAKGTSAAGASKPPAGALTVSMKVTATEKKLVEAYRKADAQTRKDAMQLLKGEGAAALAGNLVGNVIGALTGKKD